MHKYRDGIIHRERRERALQQVFILTPTKDEQAELMRYFDEDFYKKYRMGAVQLVPGEYLDGLKEKVRECIELLNNK
ncbi:hypothetical protein CWR48_13495 [Oceanobacillus arenosus]|uniref:Uncharacterized protein n=1 Tax=Oceanobacillus arenosus TaxID=1229153 RepID=A0A3D8PNI6_9BACI|nr:hypothetical protein [Oceanobacillus arenosus]RDW17534.1 hypothetical protein CWR48_13495 [Oceanobacillus arenosus]